MKKSLLILSVSAMMLAACGGGSNQSDKTNDSTKATNETAVAQNSDAAQDTTVQNNTGAEKTGGNPIAASSSKGAQLITKNDCLTCHKEHEKLIGPAYADVAKKYSSKDVDMLADKVIKGGAGNWGQVSMTPHPSLSQDDAKEMVKYILSIK